MEDKDLIFLFKIPVGTSREFFEIDIQFEHPPSKGFASPRKVQWWNYTDREKPKHS